MFKYSGLIILCLALSTGILFIYKLKVTLSKVLLYTGLVSFVAMLFFNTILTSLPIVVYNTASTLNIRVLTFPIEDIGYLLAVLMILPALFEKFINESSSNKK